MDPLDPTLPWHTVDRYLERHGVPVGHFPAQDLQPPHTDIYMQTTGGTHAGNSLHPLGRARDYSEHQGANVEAAFALLLALAVGNTDDARIYLHQLFYSPEDCFIQDGHRVPDEVLLPGPHQGHPENPRGQNLRAIHQDHLHVGLFEHVDLDGIV